MSFGETVLLGALAGFTIYLGLPFGRLQLVSARSRVALAMFSVGVLAFLFGEILVHGVEIVEHTVEELGEGEGSWGEAIGFAAILGVGFTAAEQPRLGQTRCKRAQAHESGAQNRALEQCSTSRHVRIPHRPTA